MLTKEALRRFALDEVRVDKIGVANIERFRNAPAYMSPTNIMPRARSVVVYIKQVPRGCYRGIDEGTHFSSYNSFGYAPLNEMLQVSGYRLARFIEDYGWDAAHLLAAATQRERGPAGPRVPGKPRREVQMHFRIAATLAGLGEIGWSKVFLTEEFGPRQRIGILLTDAVLEPDPIQVGKLCDRCMRCVVECPAGAISKDKAVTLEVEGVKLQWNDLDLGKCKLTHFGLNRATSPFLAKRFPGFYLPIAEQEVRWMEAFDLGAAVFGSVPFYRAMKGTGLPALCGARGCVVGCMKHMEKQGLVKNTFHRKVFSEETPWRLPERPEHVEHHGFIYDPEKDVLEPGLKDS